MTEVVTTITDSIGLKPVNRLTDMGKRFDAVRIDPRTIVVENAFNPRDFSLPASQEHVQNLKESIKTRGVEQPLWVRIDGPQGDKKPILVDGECRLKAILLALDEGCTELETVPVIQKSVGVTKPEDRLVLALTANEGLSLSAMEVGKSYIRLVQFGWDAAKIASKVGKSERFVREAIQITEAPDAVQELVKNGDVSQALAIKTVKEEGTEKAAEVLQQAATRAKADGKKQATAPKQDKKMSKLNLIRDVIEEFEALEAKEWTKDDLIKLFADISDILDENPAAMNARAA